MSTAASRRAKAFRGALPWSIALGMLAEVLLALIEPGSASLVGAISKGGRTLVICSALVAAATAVRNRTETMGIAGLAGGSLGVYAGRVIQDVLAEILNAPLAAGSGSVWLPALLKGIEYGGLGIVLSRLDGLAKGSVFPYVMAALLIGLLFGTIISTFGAVPSSPSAWVINELGLPVGCALIVRWSAASARTISASLPQG